MEIGRALKEFREEQGITQTEWAEKSGINRNYISDAENGRNNPSKETITKLVEPFDVSYIHFLFKYCSEGMIEKSEDSLNVGSGLKQLRKDKQLTQDELATMTGIARAYISAIESGRRNPTTETINNILTELGTTYIDFLIDYCGVKRETEPESPLEQNFNKLTPENQKQVSDFIEFLISKQ